MIRVISGIIIDIAKNPYLYGENSIKFIENGAVLIENDKITDIGEKNIILKQANLLDANFLHDNFDGQYISAGFIDSHLHFPQIRMLACYGARLIDWLNQYTFPEESKYQDINFARQMASVFLQILFSHGITTACAYGAVFAQSVEALFDEARNHNYSMICGKVMMNRNAPEYLQDTAQSSFDDSVKLIQKYHGIGRNKYAITPRFAITSTEEQLEMAGHLVKQNPSAYLQTHLGEQPEEIAFTIELFPKFQDYCSIYDHYGLVHEKSLMGHAIYLTQNEAQILQAKKASLVHCPSSNLFIGSGLFPFTRHLDSQKISIASDIGGGTSVSMLQTIDNAYKIAALQKFSLHPLHSYYMATAGNAENLGLEHEIGRLKSGLYADIIVLNPCATAQMKLRNQIADSHSERIFAMQILGDDRTISQTYISGKPKLNQKET